MIEWKPEMIATDRGAFEVFTAGEGDPICVTHYYSAFTARGNYFADAFVCFGKVVLVNLKECGNSDRVSQADELSMEATVRDLEAVRRALGFERWSFAGHSTGGMLGLVYAIQYERSLQKLIVVGAAASNGYMQSEDSMYGRENPNNPRLREIFSILRSAACSDQEKALAARQWTEMSLHHPEKWDEYFAKPSSGRTVQTRLDYYNRLLSSYDIRDQLHAIHTPSLVMCGKYDSQCPQVFSEEIHSLIPDSQLHVFTDSNHSPQIEEPVAFADAVKRFLNANIDNERK